jgi:hypothetical protein
VNLVADRAPAAVVSAVAGRAADKAAAVVVVSAAVAVVAWVEAAAKAEIARRVAPIEAPQFGAPFFCEFLARVAEHT